MEFKGKTVEEAVEKGLKELNLSKEDAVITVIEEKKSLFGTKAIVDIEAKAVTLEEPIVEETAQTPVLTEAQESLSDGERTVLFLEGLFKLLDITAVTELVSEGDKVEINITANNTTSVIGKHGAMLDAIQTLAGAVANTGREDYKRVVVDCENYRENREATLKKLAANLAQKAVRLGKKIKLEPMNPYERRIIHSALSETEGIKTESEGKEPNRYIVVVPDNLEDPDAPAIPARSERNDRRDNRGGRGGYGNRGGNRGGRGNFGNNRSGNKGGYKKNFNRDGKSTGSAGGTTMKQSSDFFGIFLGNSGNKDEE
ncbi:MAG: protein jag [Clostridia bacterium]|nr:protein jag [Clostridia bacterium]